MNKKKNNPLPGEMTNIDVDFISLVHKGANGQQVQIYKSDEEVPDDETKTVGSFMQVMKNFFIGKADEAETATKVSNEETSKGKKKNNTSFAQTIAVSDIMDSMWRVNDTLRSVMRNIIADESITDKKQSLSQAIDDYATYMKEKINSTAIAKSDFYDEPESNISKAGRTLSEKSLTSIKNAITALQTLLTESGGEGEIQKGDDFDMSNEEIKKIMKGALDEALQPITARLEAVEKADTQEGVGKNTEDITSENISDIVKSAVAEAVQPIQERLDKVEKSRGIARGLEDEGGTTEVEKSAGVFDGLFI